MESITREIEFESWKLDIIEPVGMKEKIPAGFI